jgi:hypothetical protein
MQLDVVGGRSDAESACAPRMMSLRDLQARFAEALDAPLAGDERLAIYARSVRANYRKSLGATYPVVQALVGIAFINALADAYVQAHPSTSGDLNLYGGRLGDFVETYAPAASLPYLADVARLEWNIDEAGRASEVEGAAEDVLAALAATPAERLGEQHLAIHPSCRFMTSEFAILHIWQVHQPGFTGEETVSLERQDAQWVIRRTMDGVLIEALDRGVFEWLTVLSRGGTLEQSVTAASAADHGFDLTDALRSCIADRTIVGVGEPRPSAEHRR